MGEVRFHCERILAGEKIERRKCEAAFPRIPYLR
jgi:hypothetical protein